jgi:Cu+-exporting ATPase
VKNDRLYAVALSIFCFCVGFFMSALPAFGTMEVQDETNEVLFVHEGHHVREAEAVVKLGTEPERVTAGTPATIRIFLSGPDGKPLQGLTLMHERYLHVVIVSQDFRVFAHIHPRDFERLTPEVLNSGRFFVRFTFPKAGRYIIGLDFAVKGRPASRHFVISVAGEPKMAAPKKDFSREKRSGGLDVTFSTAPERLTANKEAVLSYVFEKDGKPVTDLRPWLGAPMHVAIVSSDLKNLLHVHGEVPGMLPHSHDEDHMHMHIPPRFGPGIEVHVTFPAKGIYEVFGQAEHEGKVILTKFMVEVE